MVIFSLVRFAFKPEIKGQSGGAIMSPTAGKGLMVDCPCVYSFHVSDLLSNLRLRDKVVES